jgi:hypothetical protein
MKSLSCKAFGRQFANVTPNDDAQAIAMRQQEAASQKDVNLRQYATDLLPVFRSDLKTAQDFQRKISPAIPRKSNNIRKAGRVDHASS